MNKYMKIANELAEEAMNNNDGGPFGACIVKNDQIIGRGANSVLKTNDPTAHAEIMAIREAAKNLNTFDLSDCVLYTSCYPCPMCLAAIIWANIKEVYYGNTCEDAKNIGFRDEYIYKYLTNPSDQEGLKLECLDREETIKAFNKFMEKEDKTMY
ncbi:MAG: nucleoside deaminase [Bacilli bacterium]|nr:nucleoside deaminase [Bacilli bacterium]